MSFDQTAQGQAGGKNTLPANPLHRPTPAPGVSKRILLMPGIYPYLAIIWICTVIIGAPPDTFPGLCSGPRDGVLPCMMYVCLVRGQPEDKVAKSKIET